MEAAPHIARYTVLSRLGTGGMAEVFKCRQSGIGGFGKLVVIKRILPHLVDDQAFLAMFLDEARIAANLTHPNIVQVFEIDLDPRGVPYLVMEYVRGPSLGQLIKSALAANDLHLGRMVRLIAGAARGLEYAHNARDAHGQPLHIVHRDVSPHNILVSYDGVPKVADFGVAKADGRITHTQSGVVKGKLRFTAPELLVDPDHSARPRTDVFSLGVCLYLATTGQLPFKGEDDRAIVGAIRGGSYVAPSALVTGFPADLEAIIAHALDHDPERRCASGRALSEALFSWLAAHSEGTSDAELTSWVSRLCPEPEETAAPAAVPPPPPVDVDSPSGRHATPGEVIEDLEVLVTDATTSSSRAPLLFGGVVALLVLGGGVWDVFATRAEARREQEHTLRFLAFVTEAEAQLSEGRLARAEELVREAQAADGRSADGEVRLARLQADLRSARLLARTRAALSTGDLDGARAAVSEALALEPEDREAKSLLVALQHTAEALAVEHPADAGLTLTAAELEVSATRGRGSARRDRAHKVEGQPGGSTQPPPTPGPGAAETQAPSDLAPGDPEATPEPPPPPPKDFAQVRRERSEVGARVRVLAPVRAQVFIDGLPVGFTPFDGEVEPGTVIVMVLARGYVAANERVAVGASERVVLEFTLERDPYSVAPR